VEEKIVLLTLALIICGVSSIQAQGASASKPDLQKIYNEALTWSKTKLEAMPKPEVRNQGSGGSDQEPPSKVCRKPHESVPLPITAGCKKKTQQNPAEALDEELTAKQDNPEPEDKILVFVSFSMPRQSLVALSKEAQKHHAVLVMRGLKDDSFKATQTAFADLGNEVQTGIEINPEAFETYHIKQVPVFVRVKLTPGKEPQELGRLSGNVSLSFAANKLRETV
jgi:type-F conjugative transfer system pilin assembly protein TrbC